MSRRGLRGMLPSDVVIPITPMLDMSFQLLFFFICIYKPPTMEEAQFKLNSASASEAGPFGTDGPPIPYGLTIDVYTHIGTNDREFGELLIEKVIVSGALDEATKTKLEELGLIKDAKQGSVVLTYPPPGSGEAQPVNVTPQTEEQVLKQLAIVLREHRASIPAGASPPVLTIMAPRELPTFKIIKLMDYGNKYGFALDLKVMPRMTAPALKDEPQTTYAVVGQALNARCFVVEFARDPDTRQPNLELSLRVLDENGEPIQDKPITWQVNDGVEAAQRAIDVARYIEFKHPGSVTVELTAIDRIAKKETMARLPFTVVEKK